MGEKDTSLGAGQSQFPSTVWDVLNRLQDEDVNALAERYWRPVYRFIRTAWKKPVEDAKDLTQEIFTTVFTRKFLAGADPARGNFRQFVLVSLRNFLAGQYRADHREKRGGGHPLIPLDAIGADDRFEAVHEENPDKTFDRAWAAEILERAVKQLEADIVKGGLKNRFEAFRWYCLEGGAAGTYKDVAMLLGMTEAEVTRAIFTARRDLRVICSRLVADTVQDKSQVEQEMALLFGRTL